MRLALPLLLAIGAVAAAPAAADARSPRVLVTGDSMVQPLDGQLARRVKRAGGRATRDPRPGSGISKPHVLDWVRHARRQARRHRPKATVVFLGTNDAEPLRTGTGPAVECCHRAWIDEYARRAGRMMRAYARGGSGRVYWLTLPTPRGDDLARRIAAVNLAIAQAAAARGPNVRLVDTIPALSPENRYRRRIRYRGRRITVRDRDGVHLTAAGARVARDLVLRAIRADGVL